MHDRIRRTRGGGTRRNSTATRNEKNRQNSHSPRPRPGGTRLTIRILVPVHRIGLLSPRPLVVDTILIIICIRILNANPRWSCVCERPRLCLNSSVLVILFNDDRRVINNRLMVRWGKALAGSRYEFVEWRETHPHIIGVGRRWRRERNRRSGRAQRRHTQPIRRRKLALILMMGVDSAERAYVLCAVGRMLMVLGVAKVEPSITRIGTGGCGVHDHRRTIRPMMVIRRHLTRGVRGMRAPVRWLIRPGVHDRWGWSSLRNRVIPQLGFFWLRRSPRARALVLGGHELM